MVIQEADEFVKNWDDVHIEKYRKEKSVWWSKKPEVYYDLTKVDTPAGVFMWEHLPRKNKQYANYKHFSKQFTECNEILLDQEALSLLSIVVDFEEKYVDTD